MKVALVSLGCPKNLVDSEGLLGRLAAAGDVDIVADPAEADGVIVNTCGFLQAARREAEAVAAEMLALKAAGRVRWVALAGCLVERYGPALRERFPEATFLGFKDYEDVARVVAAAQAGVTNPPPPPARRGPRRHQGLHGPRLLLTRGSFAYLRLAEGCNLKCAFCVIPAIRGAYRSRPREEILAEAEALAAAGVRELVLVSQDTTFYGRDRAGEEDLVGLLRDLGRVEGIAWIRLLYLNPAFVTPALLDAVAELEPVVPYLDIPIQHASDPVLRRMRRVPDRAGLRRVFAEARRRIPGVTLRTTVMVGFPGETEADFAALLDFLAEVRFERLGCFRFSPEPGAPAAAFPEQVPESLKEERWARVMALQGEITGAAQEVLVGRTLPVLVDLPGLEAGGRTPADAPEVDCRVRLRSPRPLPVGGPVNVRILAREGYDLVGEPA